MAAPPGPAAPLLLVVDDEAMVLRLMERALEDAGYRVCAAENGVRALELGVKLATPPASLITDVRMGPMDGTALATLIRNRWPGTRVLFVTGFDDSHHVFPGPVPLKPFGPAQLTTAVRRLLEPDVLTRVVS